MTSKTDKLTTATPAVERTANSIGVGRLLGLGALLAVAAGALFLYGKDSLGEPLLLSFLGGLAAIGVFFLFSVLLGFVQLTSQRTDDLFAKTLVDGMDSGIVVNDQEGRIVYANRAYAELLGAQGDVEVTSVETMFSRRAEAAEVVYRMSNAVRKGEGSAEEFRLSSGLKNGEEGARWFRLRARGMEVKGLPGLMTVWQISDITAERRRQENAFLELQNAVNYLDHAPAGFLSSDAGGSIAYINATLADWLGIDLTKFKPGSINLVDIVLGDGMAMLEAVKPDHENPKTSVIDLDLEKSDGTTLPARLYHRPAVGPDGAPGASRTVVLNRMLSGLDSDPNAEIRFTRFFNNTPMAIAAVGEDGSVRRTNAPFHRLFAPVIEAKGGFEKLKYADLAQESERSQLEEAWNAALAGKAQITPVDLTVPGESEQFVRIFVSAISGDLGETEEDKATQDRVILYAMDRTEQRSMEEQFSQGQKMQAVGQLAGGVAHDFNNVLTAIIGFSDLLLANHRPSDPSFQDIMNIKQNANRAASLVRQLLAFSRRQTLRPQVLQLGDVISDLRMLLDRLLGEKVDLNVQHGRDLWPVRADLSQFEQVIVNLAVNARDAMSDGGKLSIRTSNVDSEEIQTNQAYKAMPAGDYVLIEVEDEGSGMSEETMEKIFEPFFSTKEVGKGTGLGLSTVYGVIKQTGGFIFPSSTLGKGTVFKVFLPRHEIDEEIEEIGKPLESAAGEEADRPRDLTGNATILLVEDEDAVRAFASRALASRGYEVHEASSGVEALEILEEEGAIFDLVVSDVVMPEMDGPTLFTAIRKEYPELRFVFMSGYAEEAFAKNLPDGDSQQFGFLPKPFSLKQLATTVKEVLDEGA